MNYIFLHKEFTTRLLHFLDIDINYAEVNGSSAFILKKTEEFSHTQLTSFEEGI